VQLPPLDSLFHPAPPQTSLHSPHLLVTDFIQTDLSSPMDHRLRATGNPIHGSQSVSGSLHSQGSHPGRCRYSQTSPTSFITSEQVPGAASGFWILLAEPGLQFAHRHCQLGLEIHPCATGRLIYSCTGCTPQANKRECLSPPVHRKPKEKRTNPPRSEVLRVVQFQKNM